MTTVLEHHRYRGCCYGQVGQEKVRGSRAYLLFLHVLQPGPSSGHGLENHKWVNEH